MTTPIAPYARCTMLGKIGTTQTWSTGLSVVVSGAPDQAALNALLTAFQTAATVFWNGGTPVGLKARNMPDVTLTGFRAYLYSTGGTGQASLQAGTDITPIPGTGTAALPTQCSLVASLLTGQPGRSRRGRMYLPYTVSNTLDTNHQITLAEAAIISGRVKTLIDSINASAITGFARVSIVGPTAASTVSSVRVDSELDIQRRRADKILAAFQSVAAIA